MITHWTILCVYPLAHQPRIFTTLDDAYGTHTDGYSNRAERERMRLMRGFRVDTRKQAEDVCDAWNKEEMVSVSHSPYIVPTKYVAIPATDYCA